MDKMFKKSQAAMEFLMTYGWAILVVLVAIGALAYFGVLSPDQFLPAKCTLPAGIACTDFKVAVGATASEGTVDVVLRNAMGYGIGSKSSTAGETFRVEVGGCTGAFEDNSADTVVLANGQQSTFRVTGCSISAGKFSGVLNVSYQNADTKLMHKAQGSITGRAE